MHDESIANVGSLGHQKFRIDIQNIVDGIASELRSTASPVPKEERTHEFLQKFYDEAVIASARRGYVHDNIARTLHITCLYV